METPRHTHDTAPTQFVETAGTRFAYRRFGGGPRTPVVLTQHFRGNMDNFDPAITDALAADREVILFDQAGVGASSGPAKGTVDAMAADAAAFLDTLDLDALDLIGHSMGGEVAQLVALSRPHSVRRLVLVGTGPRGGAGMNQRRPGVAELFAAVLERQDEMWLPIMFSPSAQSQAAGREWLERIRARPDRDAPVVPETLQAHSRASGLWGEPDEDDFAYLRSITQRTLVVNGDDDVVIATINSYVLFQHIQDAYLILYPDSGHGSHFQRPGLFVEQVRAFLDSES
jgi:pimeloyl-ACP methyl ester carboxylesterase